MDSTLQEEFRPGVNKMDADIGAMKRKRTDTPTHTDGDEPPPTKKCAEEEAFGLADCDYPTTGILDMCDEVLTAIFRHVDSFTLLALMNSNQRFKRLLCDRYFWIHIDLSQKPLPLGILEDVLEWSSVKTEYIKFHGPTPDELGDGEIKQFCTIMANSFSTRCTQLRELELQHVVIDFSFLNILNFPKTLKRLMIRSCCVRERKIHSIFYGIETHLVKLEELGFEFCDWFEPYFIMGISKVPTLRWLSLKGCRQLAEFVPYGSMATRFGFKKLEFLDLRFTPLTDSDLQCFNVVHTLKEILLDCPDSMRRGSAAARAEASRRRLRAEAVPGPSISTEAEEAASNPNMPSTSRGCGPCVVSVDVAGPAVELAPLQVARVAQSGSVLAIVLEGAPHLGGGGGGAPNASRNGVANGNLMPDMPEAPPAPQPNEPPAAEAPQPEAAAVREETPAVAPAPSNAGQAAAGSNEPAAAGAPAAGELPRPGPVPPRPGYRGVPYPLVISLAAMQRGGMPNPAAGGGEAARGAANGADDVSAAVAAYRGVVGAARAVAERLQNEGPQAEQPAQPGAMGEVICLDINNPRRPIFIQGVQRGLRMQANNNNPNNANDANNANNANQQAANENPEQNNANNNNNQNNANNVNANANGNAHQHMHNLDRVVRHPMFWDLIDPLARQAGGLGVLGNNGAGAAPAGGAQPGVPGGPVGGGNPLLQLCRNMRFGGDAGGRSRYAFFRTAHPISDRGICCFGRPRNPVEQGIIWIRVGNRPANTNFIRISVRNYIQVTDISLRHLAVCAPYLRFLDVSGTGVTRDGIEKFKRQNITCRIVAEHLRYDDGYESRSDSSDDGPPAPPPAEGPEEEMREGVRRRQERGERRNQDYDGQRNPENGNGDGNAEDEAEE